MLPTTMTAIDITEPGGPDALVPVTMAVPTPKAGEVLIKVEAAGINRPDVFQRMGLYPAPPGAPTHPGLEVAGTIVALGDGVSHFTIGDKICALVAGGGYAAYVCAAVETCLMVPGSLTMEEAAALPETFFTVWSNIFDRARLAEGESLLVHGGASGIGTTAIQMATALGHTVYTTAGSDEKCTACEKLGAAKAVNYKTDDFVEAIKAETGGKGVDVVLDMVGGDYIPRSIGCMAVEGRFVSIAFLQGSTAEVNFMLVMLKRLTITGSTLRARDLADKKAIADQLTAHVMPLVADGQIKPQVFKTFPLEDAAKAHELMESSAHIGKIVLTVTH